MSDGFTDVLAGVEDSGFGRLLVMFGGMSKLLSRLVDGITTGRNAPIRFSDLFNKPGSFTLRLQRAAETRQYSAYDSIKDDIVSDQSDIAMANMLKALGYSGKALEDAKSTLGYKFASWGFNAFLNPWDDGLETFGKAAYKRRYAFLSGDEPGTQQSNAAQLITTRRLMEAFTEDFTNSKYGNLSMTDAGAVAARLISTGKYDAYYSDRYNKAVPLSQRDFLSRGYVKDRIEAAQQAYIDTQLDTDTANYYAAHRKSIEKEVVKRWAGNKGQYTSEEDVRSEILQELQQSKIIPEANRLIQNNVIDQVSRDSENTGRADRVDAARKAMRDYARTLEKMKDVIGGDIPEVLDKLDKLFGGTTIAMQAEQLDKIATSMRHAALVTGMKPQDLARAGAVAANYILDVGGSQLEAVGIGTDAAYYAAGGVRNHRTSVDKIKEGVVRMEANEMREGTVSSAVAAYLAWMGENPNNTASMSKFLNEIYTGPKNTSGFMEYMNAVVDRSNLDQEGKRRLRASYMSGSEARRIRDTENVAGMLMESRIDSFANTRENTIRQVLEKTKYSNLDISSIVGNKYSTDEEIGSRLSAALTKAGADQREAQSLVQGFIDIDRNRAMTYTGLDNTATMYGIIENRRQAEALKSRVLYADELKDVLGNMDSFLTSGSGGFSDFKNNIVKYLAKTGKRMGGDTAIELISGVLGVDLKTLDYKNMDNGLRNTLLGRAQGYIRGSNILMGYRDPEKVSETESKTAEVDYIKRATSLGSKLLDTNKFKELVAVFEAGEPEDSPKSDVANGGNFGRATDYINNLSVSIDDFLSETKLTKEERGFYRGLQEAINTVKTGGNIPGKESEQRAEALRRIEKYTALTYDPKALAKWLDNNKKINTILASKKLKEGHIFGAGNKYDSEVSRIDDIASDFYLDADSKLKDEFGSLSKKQLTELATGKKLKETDMSSENQATVINKMNEIMARASKEGVQITNEDALRIMRSAETPASTSDILNSILRFVKEIAGLKREGK